MRRHFAILVILFSLAMGLSSCKPSKPKAENQNNQVQEYVLVTPEQGEELLKQFKNNNYNLSMLTFDVVVNGDAIINIEEKNAKIIKVIEENRDILTPEQLERYKELREDYRKQSGY